MRLPEVGDLGPSGEASERNALGFTRVDFPNHAENHQENTMQKDRVFAFALSRLARGTANALSLSTSESASFDGNSGESQPGESRWAAEILRLGSSSASSWRGGRQEENTGDQIPVSSWRDLRGPRVPAPSSRCGGLARPGACVLLSEHPSVGCSGLGSPSPLLAAPLAPVILSLQRSPSPVSSISGLPAGDHT